jgi:capsule polysaccharide export protein KpsC/LpsZ
VPSYTSTHDLLDRSKFVAAVTGTVGWEAIRQGKLALIFGHPWYLSLPGVIPFHQELTIDEILDTKIDHQELEKMAGELVQRMHDGITDKAYLKIATNFNREDNGVAVANQLHQIIMDHKRILFQ